MSMDRLKICNRALVVLQANPIATVEDEGVEAGLCSDHWENCLDAVTQMHTWSFARARLAMTAGPTPAFEYSYSWVLPVFPYCLKPLTINANESRPDGDEFVVEGRYLLTNAASANLRYIRKLEEEDLVHAGVLFGEVVAMYLAWLIAPNLQGTDRQLDRIERNYEKAYIRAITADAQMDNINTTFPATDEYLNARGATAAPRLPINLTNGS
jgi:hypothetical protein